MEADRPAIRDRPTVRVLLLSPERRLLLLYCRNRLTATPPKCWVTSGGGIEPGETVELAARREIREETGICEIEVGPVVWTRNRVALHHGVETLFRQFFVVAFSAEQAVDFAGAMADERDDLIDARWWSMAELRATDEPIMPPQLPELIEPVLAGRYSDPPIVLPES